MASDVRQRCLAPVWASLLAMVGLVAAQPPTAPPAYEGGCPYNITGCCDRAANEAIEACLEFEMLFYSGFNGITCRNWALEVRDTCVQTCGNCTEMGRKVKQRCTFSLVFMGDGNGPIVERYCTETEHNYINYRCPTVCAPMRDPDHWDKCNSPEGLECMAKCGSYSTCDCRRIKGTFGVDKCYGEPVWDGQIPNQSAGVTYDCDLAVALPECKHHVPPPSNETLNCSKYRLCEPDMCILMGTKCVAPTQCHEQGTCNPRSGLCFAGTLVKGTPCDDGLAYTDFDECDNGFCSGIVDYCKYYNVTCQAMNPCTYGGLCHPRSGRCTYDLRPNGLQCDDNRIYTFEDKCENGLCVGMFKDLCVEWGTVCTAPSVCYTPGTCDPKTGECSEPVPTLGEVPCDDGDETTHNDTCVDGVCLGRLPENKLKFVTLGKGACEDRDGNRMASYSGDVLDELECEAQCMADPQCQGYGYQFPLCTIYGTVRTRSPPLAERDWAFYVGTVPAAVALERASISHSGQRAMYCRRKGTREDVVDPDTQVEDPVNIFDPLVLMTYAVIAVFIFGIPACLFLSCRMICPQRQPKEDDESESEESEPEGFGARMRKKWEDFWEEPPWRSSTPVTKVAMVPEPITTAIVDKEDAFSELPGDWADRFLELVTRQNSLAYKYPQGLQKALLTDFADTDFLQQEVVKYTDDTWPIMHRWTAKLARTFLLCKQEYGNSIETEMYCELQLDDFVQRLLTMRPLMFTGELDDYLLRDGRTRGNGGFEEIGTEAEEYPLVLADYLSYEETELTALMCMSSPVRFFNRGHRFNQGVPDLYAANFVDTGILLGLPGTRFQKEGLLDRKHMVITLEQNTVENGYGEAGFGYSPMLSAFARAYGVEWFPTFEEAECDHGLGALRYIRLEEEDAYFDTDAYRGRCQLIAETFLAEANERAMYRGAKAFCHIVGLGLGAAQIDPSQAQIQVDAYATVVQKFHFHSLGELHFVGFGQAVTTCHGVASGQTLTARAGELRIGFSDRDVAAPLPEPLTGRSPWLLVAMYEWNRNSYPGNEFWDGDLTAASGQPAVACCSTLPVIQNPDINSEAFAGDRVALVPHPSAANTPRQSSKGSKSPFADASPTSRFSYRSSSPRSPQQMTLEEAQARLEVLIQRQEGLPYKHPNGLPKALLRDLVDTEEMQMEVVRFSDDSWPIVHRRAAKVARLFLSHKQQHGTDLEKEVYRKLDLEDLIERLLTKRPIVFYTDMDEYLLRDGVTKGRGGFETIGTQDEQEPLILADYICYEEMELSALVCMSCWTHFHNAGGRYNRGVPESDDTKFTQHAVYIGMAGTRFDKKGLMDRKHMIVTPSQNTEENGYGEGGLETHPVLAAFARCYGTEYFPTYDEADIDHTAGEDRYIKLEGEDAYFDTQAYQGRCEIMAESFLAEANERALFQGCKAFCHVVGLGLDMLQLQEKQGQIQVDAYATIVRRLSLPAVGEIHFSGFGDGVHSCGGVENGGVIETGVGAGVRVVFGNRDPAAPLPELPDDELQPWLLVAQFEWSGNSYVGNEYWFGELDASGQTAAACGSTIASLLNPDVNPEAFSGDRVALVPHPSAHPSPRPHSARSVLSGRSPRSARGPRKFRSQRSRRRASDLRSSASFGAGDAPPPQPGVGADPPLPPGTPPFK